MSSEFVQIQDVIVRLAAITLIELENTGRISIVLQDQRYIAIEIDNGQARAVFSSVWRMLSSE